MTKKLSAEEKRGYLRPGIYRLRRGERNVTQRPIRKTGYYVSVGCHHSMCCPPEGPFSTKAKAIAWSRRRLWCIGPALTTRERRINGELAKPRDPRIST